MCPPFKESVIRSYQIQFIQDLNNYNSLLIYKLIKTNTSALDYLKSNDTKIRSRAVQLKFNIRTGPGVLGLGADLHRQHRTRAMQKL